MLVATLKKTFVEIFASYILRYSVTMPPHMRKKGNTVRDAATKSGPMEIKHYKT